MLIIVWWANKRITNNKRLKQLLVFKKRGKLLLEGITHYISLNKHIDYTIYFPELATDRSVESTAEKKDDQSPES